MEEDVVLAHESDIMNEDEENGTIAHSTTTGLATYEGANDGLADIEIDTNDTCPSDASSQEPANEHHGGSFAATSLVSESAQLSEVDERERPYSAWLLYPEKAQTVLAASRYTRAFPQLRRTLAQEPSVEFQARREASELSNDGGEIIYYVSKQFLDAFMDQQELERQLIARDVDHLSNNLDHFEIEAEHAHKTQSDYNMSDGEEYEPDSEAMIES